MKTDTTRTTEKTSYWSAVTAAVLGLFVFLPRIALLANKMSSESIPQKEKMVCGSAALVSLTVFCCGSVYAAFKIRACGMGLSIGLVMMAVLLVFIGLPHLNRPHTGDYMQGIGDTMDFAMIAIAFGSVYCVYALGSVWKKK